jgi:hypothetical protein
MIEASFKYETSIILDENSINDNIFTQKNYQNNYFTNNQNIFNNNLLNNISYNDFEDRKNNGKTLSKILYEKIQSQMLENEFIFYKQNDNNIEYIKREDELSKIINQQKFEKKKRMEKIKEEKAFKKFIDNFYKKNEKEVFNRIIKSNIQKRRDHQRNLKKLEKTNNKYKSQLLKNINKEDKNIRENKINIASKFSLHSNKMSFISKPNKDNSEKKNKNSIRNGDIDNENEKDHEERKENDNHKMIIYNIIMNVYDLKNTIIFNKELKLDENTHYFLNLDKLYCEIVAKLRLLKIDYKYGLKYIINGYELKDNVGQINLLEYEVLGYFKTNEDYSKKINFDITIINI